MSENKKRLFGIAGETVMRVCFSKATSRFMATAAVALVAAGVVAEGFSRHSLAAVEHQQTALNSDGYVSFGPLVNGDTISFLRLVNTTSATTTFSFRAFGFPSGVEYTTVDVGIDVPAHASPQKSINDLTGIAFNANVNITPKGNDTALTFFLKNTKAGKGVAVQHVTYNQATGYFENASVCTFDSAFAPDTSVLRNTLVNVHTTALSGYPSTIQLTNPDATSRIVTGTVYDAATGTAIGAFPATTIPANGAAQVSMASVQTSLNLTPTNNQQVNIVFTSGDSSAYTAVPAHLVKQSASGAIFNLTMACPLNPTHPVSLGGTGTGTGGTGTTVTIDPTANPSGS